MGILTCLLKATCWHLSEKGRDMASLARMVSFLDELLDTRAIDDHSCNGLQVQGPSGVRRVALAVDAALEVYDGAVREGCELLIVHHGLFWGGIRSVTDRMYRHLRFLFDNGLGLYASHLPLDLHPRQGNNALLAQMLGLEELYPFGQYQGRAIGLAGTLPAPVAPAVLGAVLTERLGGESAVLDFGPARAATVGVVSGGGAYALEEAIERRLDCLVTGEVQHQHYHLAREGNISVVYSGHYHTEKPGVQALGELLTETFGVETSFIDIPVSV